MLKQKRRENLTTNNINWDKMTGEEAPVACGKCDYCREMKQLSGFTHASEIEV